jgi:uncharacterized protein YndB with AHSA1/START domain
MRDLPAYVLERAFDAPRELVWKAWTDPTLLPRWYGPNAETIVHRLDLKAGGLCLVEMKWGGKASYQRIEYNDVVAPERLVWLHATADSEWNIVPSPMMPDWPRLLLTTVTFADDSGRTRLRLTWIPHQASEAEVACFAAAIERIGKGWDAGMELLAKLLEELQT